MQSPFIAMFAQLTTAASATAGIVIALVTGAAAVAKKYITRKTPKPDYLTRAEFHEAMDKTRDRIGASYLALADKIELQHSQVLTALERQGANFERRLDTLDSAVARLDERTRAASPHHSITPPPHQSTNPPIQ